MAESSTLENLAEAAIAADRPLDPPPANVLRLPSPPAGEVMDPTLVGSVLPSAPPSEVTGQQRANGCESSSEAAGDREVAALTGADDPMLPSAELPPTEEELPGELSASREVEEETASVGSENSRLSRELSTPSTELQLLD